MEQAIEQLISYLAAQFPILVSVFTVMGASRLFFRCIRFAVEKFITESPSLEDNAWYERQKPKFWYRALTWWADTTFSVKIPAKNQ